jgi:hypothetical protein
MNADMYQLPADTDKDDIERAIKGVTCSSWDFRILLYFIESGAM